LLDVFLRNNTANQVIIIISDEATIDDRLKKKVTMLKKKNDVIWIDIYDSFERGSDNSNIVA